MRTKEKSSITTANVAGKLLHQEISLSHIQKNFLESY